MDWLEIKEFIKDTLKYIILIIVVLVIALYVVSLQQVVGPSMSPTFESGDVLILDKITKRFSDVNRGDIVSVNYADTKYLIKRVVGMPGETIEFKNNTLYINNEPYKENYLPKGAVTDDFSINSLGYNIIPEDMYLVLGDNRSNSQDSRDPKVGLIKKEDIIGFVRFQIWPLNKIKVAK